MPLRWPESYVALTLLAAVLFAAGNALQKQAVTRRVPPLPASEWLERGRRVFAGLLRSPAWMSGLALTIAAFAVEIQALALGDVTVVKPLSRIQIVFVLAIGAGALGERLARAEWLGVGMIVAGAVSLAGEPGGSRVLAPRTEVIAAVAAGAFFGLGDVLMKAATEVARTRTGGFSLASADTLASVAVAPELVFSLVATTLAFAMQQMAFARGRVSLVVPLVGVAGTAVVVVLGAALLGEQVGAARAAGIAVMLAGTLLIGRAAP